MVKKTPSAQCVQGLSCHIWSLQLYNSRELDVHVANISGKTESNYIYLMGSLTPPTACYKHFLMEGRKVYKIICARNKNFKNIV